MLEKSFDHVYDKPFDKSFEISQINKKEPPSKGSDADLNDREEMKDLFERANSILNQSQISNIYDPDVDNSRLSNPLPAHNLFTNLFKFNGERPTLKDLL